MNTSDQVKNTLSFITDILNQDVLPYFDQANHEYSVTDMSAILSKFLILQQSIVNLEGTFDQKIALIESPIIREINVTENCQTVIIPDLDILAHGGSYEIEILVSSSSSTASYLKFLLNDDLSEALYKLNRASFSTTANVQILNYASIGYLYGLSNCHSIFNFNLSPMGKFYYSGRLSSNTGTSIISALHTGIRTDSLTNVISLTIYSDVANGIGAGSKIIIRRKDV